MMTEVVAESMSSAASSPTLQLLLVNGGMGFLIAMVLIRVLGRVAAKASGDLVTEQRALRTDMVQEIRALRGDLTTAAAAQTSAITGMTDRVSRLEGKVEGLVMVRAPELSDDNGDDLTPISVPIPQPVHDEPAKRVRTPGLGSAQTYHHLRLRKR